MNDALEILGSLFSLICVAAFFVVADEGIEGIGKRIGSFIAAVRGKQ